MAVWGYQWHWGLAGDVPGGSVRAEDTVTRSGVLVRVAEPDDVEELVGLCLEARGESSVGPQLCTSDADVLAGQLRLFVSSEEGHILVAHVDGRLAGLLLARFVGPSLFTPERAAHVEAIYVGSDARRRGIGHALLAELTVMAEAAQVRHVYAIPLPGARGMLRFLARLGFAPAAAFRVATLPALQRRLALRGTGARGLARSRGVERLIALRRVASGSRRDDSSRADDDGAHGAREASPIEQAG